jgi:hypothetical protein
VGASSPKLPAAVARRVQGDISTEGVASAASSTSEAMKMNETTPTITLDGATYAVSDLTQVARDTLQSIQFVEARLQQLQGETAVSQTAHVAFARALKAELAQTPGTVSSTTPSP